jgi:hypothetical protein
MLSRMGRGASDTVVYSEQIFERMGALLGNAQLPCLTDIKLSGEGLQDLDMYPSPIPDLYASAPLVHLLFILCSYLRDCIWKVQR